MPKKNLLHEMDVLALERGGIFPVLKRELVEGVSTLIVSYGGTGSDALEVIKHNLERYVEKGDLESRVRLLAIDTDMSTKTTKVVVRESSGQETVQNAARFTDKEFFWLDNGPGRQAVSLFHNDEAMRQWINPNLPDSIKANPTWLNGSGASSTRQLGRVLLFPGKTMTQLQTKIRTLVKEITDETNNRLQVLIITGISGGTGSGIVIDASYMIRNCIMQMEGGLGDRAEYYGFLLLPPTGQSTNPVDIKKGNRNGIAALKEIDHYMSIAFRDETYEATLGNGTIISKENIFTTCYLIDGTQSVAVTNPREKANEVVSDCILDMMTSQPVKNEQGQNNQDVSAFMSDAAAYAVQMVSNNSERLAPRNANYVYCALGHGKTLIPIELMKAYVAKLSFDEVYKLFKKCENVTEEDVVAFVKEIWTKPFNSRQQRQNLFRGVDEMFRDVENRGPYYCVNFLKAVMEYCQDKKTDTEAKPLLIPGLRQDRIAHYDCIREAAGQLNRRFFKTYTTVLDVMSAYLKEQYGIICDSKRLESYSGSTYTFIPINFGGTDEKAAQVKTYLNKLINSRRTQMLIAQGLVKEMVEHREEWTQLETTEPVDIPKFDAAKRIRHFWKEKIDQIVTATLEDYLIKYYSGNPDAEYQEIVTEHGKEPTPESVQYMQTAASQIVQQMWGGAGVATPLAELQSQILTLDNFNGHNLFLVPKSAPHLKEYIETALSDNNIRNVRVIESYAEDRLSCYAQYTGLPAFMFKWAHRAEPNYEDALKAADIGLHISETKGGEHWQNYPNLLVEDIWDMLQRPAYNCPREAAIDRQADALFEMARGLGLTHKRALATRADTGFYTLYTLPELYRPDTALFKDVDTEKPGTPARTTADKNLANEVEKKAQLLFALTAWGKQARLEKSNIRSALEALSINFGEKKLQFVNGVMTSLSNAENWEEKLAAQLLRTCPAYMFEVRGTVLVLERLFELIRDAQDEKTRLRAFAHFLSAKQFYYNEELLEWNYLDGAVEKQLCEMDFGVREQQYAKYYFIFRAFERDYTNVYEALMPAYQDMLSGESRQEMLEKRRDMKEKATGYIEEVQKALSPDRQNPEQQSILTTQAFRRLAEERYNVDEIIDFYKRLLGELENIPNPDFA